MSGAELNAWRKLSYTELSFEILRKFATDVSDEELRVLGAKTYLERTVRSQATILAERTSFN